MTEQEIIRTKRQALKIELLEAQQVVDEIKGKFQALRNRCRHPDLKTGTDYSGCPDGYCPDCGYSY